MLLGEANEQRLSYCKAAASAGTAVRGAGGPYLLVSQKPRPLLRQLLLQAVGQLAAAGGGGGPLPLDSVILRGQRHEQTLG